MSLVACSGGGSDSIAGAGGTEARTWGITGGVAVDPYIVGATFFEDVNGNGRWDQGEQISSPSDEQGRFTFDRPVPAGHTIIMLERGTHQGLPFTGQMRRLITAEDSGTVVVTPLTTLLAQAFTGGEISSLLNSLNGYRDYDFAVDPMAGLAALNGSVSEAELVDLRANLYVGALLDLFQMGWEFADLDYQNLEPNNDELLEGLREGLRYATNPTSQNEIAALLPGGYSLPPVTMREVAETIPALLNWWKQELIRRAISGEAVAISSDEFKDLVAAAMPELGLHYYLRNNQGDPAVRAAIDDNLLPPASDQHAGLAQDRSKQLLGEPSLQQEFLSNRIFHVGNQSLLRFSSATGGNPGSISLTYQDRDGRSATISGTWLVQGNLLILGDETGDTLGLELITDWSSHLSLRVKGEAAADHSDSFVSKLLEETRWFQVAGS
ncbi:hypothetical protein ACHHRT_08955 [Desulfurivibrio sp. D14AmB]|uniref:hypothetical protein n=1 Tax=Desulfurivibrio sp. D14AmB TaxID=3374370 RepID=UPI00376F229E